MKNKLLIVLVLLLVFPIKIFAISSDYQDMVKDVIKLEDIDENKVNLYLFHGQECPHCEEEREWLKDINNKYNEYLNIYYFEVWHDDNNSKMMNDVKNEFNITRNSVPLTIIGDKYYIGYSKTIGSSIEEQIRKYIDFDNNSNKVDIPLLGNVNIKDVSIPLVGVILGFIDGFNPCAMWILLFLINMLFGMKDKKRAWFLGFTFLLISGLVYFLSMVGINFVIGVVTIKWLKILIALFIFVAGILNFKKYLKIRKEETGCTIIDSKKRKKIITKINNIINSNSFILSLLGIIILATSVNLIELACSLGFPVIFNEILSINGVTGLLKISYLLIYLLFYMIDDIIVFTISMITLQATGITNKYNKLSTLISALIMIIMGLLLIFKPDWLMLNF